MNTKKLLAMARIGDDDPWTPGEYNAVIRYMLSIAGKHPVSQVECMTAIGSLAGERDAAREMSARQHKAIQHLLAIASHSHGVGSCIGCVDAGEVMREYDDLPR